MGWYTTQDTRVESMLCETSKDQRNKQWGFESWASQLWWMWNQVVPMGTRCNNNIIMTSKWYHDIIMMLSLCLVSAGVVSESQLQGHLHVFQHTYLLCSYSHSVDVCIYVLCTYLCMYIHMYEYMCLCTTGMKVFINISVCRCSSTFTHWGWDTIAAISQITFSNTFSWLKMYKFWSRFH